MLVVHRGDLSGTCLQHRKVHCRKLHSRPRFRFQDVVAQHDGSTVGGDPVRVRRGDVPPTGRLVERSDGRRLNTVEQIAAEFGVTRPTIYRHLAKLSSTSGRP
ncbi:ArsR family transcriptional regulator [Dactylosporangium sp. NPDC000521]|uniref:ArsR family transcriptional regulator n=1 Tax=Dactylosporangium sp. NPDC000521 TaxID=3363975 RepID=UPI00367755D4